MDVDLRCFKGESEFGFRGGCGPSPGWCRRGPRRWGGWGGEPSQAPPSVHPGVGGGVKHVEQMDLGLVGNPGRRQPVMSSRRP